MLWLRLAMGRELGSGWINRWGGICLRVEFPRLFLLLLEKEETLRMVFDRRCSVGEWVFSFRRPLRAWEEVEVARLKSILDAAPLPVNSSSDWLCWSPSSAGQFSVASVYNRPSDQIVYAVPPFIWSSFSPPKSQFFAWLAWKGRIKSAEYLQRIGVLGANANVSCVFCNSAVESLVHVLLFCPVVWEIWSKLVGWWGLSWVMPGSVEGLLIWWSGIRFSKIGRKMWLSLPLAILRAIWKSRNECKFQEALPGSKLQFLQEEIKIKVVMWAKYHYPNSAYSVHDLVNNIHLLSHPSVGCCSGV
ncbi:unnamed protein product [Camellia sinensis]